LDFQISPHSDYKELDVLSVKKEANENNSTSTFTDATLHMMALKFKFRDYNLKRSQAPDDAKHNARPRKQRSD
jgi:hypothetical protein